MVSKMAKVPSPSFSSNVNLYSISSQKHAKRTKRSIWIWRDKSKTPVCHGCPVVVIFRSGFVLFNAFCSHQRLLTARTRACVFNSIWPLCLSSLCAHNIQHFVYVAGIVYYSNLWCWGQYNLVCAGFWVKSKWWWVQKRGGGLIILAINKVLSNIYIV